MTFGWVRLVTWIVAFAVGCVYGFAGTISHSYVVGGFPLGLVLSLIGSAALLVAVRQLTGDRWAALAAGLGMILAVVVLGGTGPGGSVIVPSGDLDKLGGVSLGLVWTVAVPVLTAIVVVWPSRRAPRPATDGGAGGHGSEQSAAP